MWLALHGRKLTRCHLCHSQTDSHWSHQYYHAPLRRLHGHLAARAYDALSDRTACHRLVSRHRKRQAGGGPRRADRHLWRLHRQGAFGTMGFVVRDHDRCEAISARPQMNIDWMTKGEASSCRSMHTRRGDDEAEDDIMVIILQRTPGYHDNKSMKEFYLSTETPLRALDRTPASCSTEFRPFPRDSDTRPLQTLTSKMLRS